MKNKLLAVLTVSAMALAGCGSSGEAEADPTKQAESQDAEFLRVLDDIDEAGTVYQRDKIPESTREEIEEVLTHVGRETCATLEKVPEGERTQARLEKDLTELGKQNGYDAQQIATIFGAANPTYCDNIADKFK